MPDQRGAAAQALGPCGAHEVRGEYVEHDAALISTDIGRGAQDERDRRHSLMAQEVEHVVPGVLAESRCRFPRVVDDVLSDRLVEPDGELFEQDRQHDDGRRVDDVGHDRAHLVGEAVLAYRVPGAERDPDQHAEDRAGQQQPQAHHGALSHQRVDGLPVPGEAQAAVRQAVEPVPVADQQRGVRIEVVPAQDEVDRVDRGRRMASQVVGLRIERGAGEEVGATRGQERQDDVVNQPANYIESHSGPAFAIA